MALVQTHDLTFRRGRTTILHGLSVTIHPGEYVGLLGPSGCGKSTFVRTMLGLLSPHKGTITYDSLLQPTNGQLNMGYVPQDDVVHTSLTVKQALYYAFMLRATESIDEGVAHKKVQQILKLLDLETRAKNRVRHLSGGERKRVNLGIELLHDPALLFLDEPTAGLDPHLEREMMKLFRKLMTPRRSILVTTHRLANVTMFDMVLFLVQGTLVFGGRPEHALAFFQVDDYERIYSKVRLLAPDAIARKFQQSEWYQPFLHRLPPQPSHPSRETTTLPEPASPTYTTPQEPPSSIDAQLAQLKAQAKQSQQTESSK